MCSRLVRRSVWVLGLVQVSGVGCASSRRDFDGVTVSSEAPPRSVTHEEIVRRSAEAIAVVETGAGRGMAFVIDPKGYLITNRHVVEDAEFVDSVRMPASTPPREYKSVKVVYIDPERDLALLQVPVSEPLPSLPLATNLPSSGRRFLDTDDPVVVFRHDDAKEGHIRANNGEVFDLAVYNPEAGPGAFVGFSVDIRRGQSGGPLLDRHGRAIGVVTWMWKNRRGGYAIPISEAARMLDERPQLDSESQQYVRAMSRTREFLAALGRGDLDNARRLTSPSHAREVRERSIASILGSLDDAGQAAVRGFLEAVDTVMAESNADVRQDVLRDIVARTATLPFREMIGVGEEVSDGQMISLFFELGQSYLAARAAHGKDHDAALDDAMRRLATTDAARTFAIADALTELAGSEIEITAVEVVPGAYSPRAVVSLVTTPAHVNALATVGNAAVSGSAATTRVTLHMKLEWGDWYVASVKPTPLTG